MIGSIARGVSVGCMDIRPVSFDQIVTGRDGRQYEVTGEAGRIARRLQELEPSLRVRFNEGGMFFVVYQLIDAGKCAVAREEDATGEHLVMRVPMGDWDDRVIREWEMRAHELRNGISAAERLDALDAKRQAEAEYEQDQMLRAGAAPLFRAFQRNLLGQNPRAFIRRRAAA